MSILRKSATISSKISTASRTLGGVTQATSGLINSTAQAAAAVRGASVNGITNVGTGVVNAIPGVARGIGSAAGAVAALGAVTGNSKLLSAAGKAAALAGAVGAAGAAINQIAGTVGAVAKLFGPGGADNVIGAADNAIGGIVANPLHAYASYNYLFGLYALTDGEINGGSRAGAGLAIIDEPLGGIGSTTFIDNIRLTGTIGLDQIAGNSNTQSISFKIIEPYSMGKFWETMQAAALAAGHKNYAAAPYMLSIKFKGHFGEDELFQTVPNTDKYMHIKIREVTMRVTAKGSEYDVEAYPWSAGGMSSSFAEIKTDVNISCNKGGPYTVKALLKDAEKSLKETINKKLKDDKDRKKNVTYAHEIDIVFPPAPCTDNSDGNPIGESKLGLDQFNKGDATFSKDNATYDSATGIYRRGEIQIDTKNADFKFAQGASVQDIINQIVLTSDYGRKALEEANINAQGMVTWWRIETHLHNISGDEDPKTGEKAKKVIFRVVPYEIDAAIFYPPNSASKTATATVNREFNYIYTGKNHDILDFSIEYKMGFYKAFTADAGRNTEGTVLASATGQAAPAPSGGSTASPQPSGGNGPEFSRSDKTHTRTAKAGGALSFDDAATIAARQFHDLATTGYDMQNLTLKILGDPFFIGDSGHGNFTLAPSPDQIAWQKGQALVKVTFRTPEDANTDSGFYDFAGGDIVKEFTGIYKVQEVVSEFNRGKFTQTLSMFKSPTQSTGSPGAYRDKNPNPQDPPYP
jgi:hypothetical protein